jgi:hypothetical protein
MNTTDIKELIPRAIHNFQQDKAKGLSEVLLWRWMRGHGLKNTREISEETFFTLLNAAVREYYED